MDQEDTMRVLRYTVVISVWGLVPTFADCPLPSIEGRPIKLYRSWVGGVYGRYEQRCLTTIAYIPTFLYRQSMSEFAWMLGLRI